MSLLDDLTAACDALAADTHYAQKTRTMATALRKWAVTVPTDPVPPPAVTPVPVGPLMFSDLFLGTAIDTVRWDVKARTNTYSGTTFTPANVSVHDGLLDIVATKDANGRWLAGELSGKQSYTGPRYIEVRAKVPAGAGAWAAPLWEWDAPYGANGIELDVCEQLGREPTVYHFTVHNGPSEHAAIAIDTGVVLAADYHRFGAAVYPDRADAYFDGLLVGSIKASALTAWRFTVTPMVALVDLDMGGAWAGSPSVAPPLHETVDYVKVWPLA